MKTDLNAKYRPRFFRDFWRTTGAVEYAQKIVCQGLALIKALMLAGDYGTGKTSLARVMAVASSCQNRTAGEPCGTCYECSGFPDSLGESETPTSITFSGEELTLKDMDRICRFGRTYSWGAPPGVPYVCIIDEAHLLQEKLQSRLANEIDQSSLATFILCTTHPHETPILEARSHVLAMVNPTETEAVNSMRKIALQESKEPTDEDLTTIARRNNCNPRACLKDLHLLLCLNTLPYSPQTTRPLF